MLTSNFVILFYVYGIMCNFLEQNSTFLSHIAEDKAENYGKKLSQNSIRIVDKPVE